MVYAIGDRIELTAELGGTIGTIFDHVGGPGPEGSYRIACRYGENNDNDGAVAPPSQIAALLPPPPAFVLGQAVSLAGEAGTITAISGDLYTVEVLVDLGERRWRQRGRGNVVCPRYRRDHKVPGWRLALEN